MDSPTLEDRLRQATRHFSSRLAEDEVFRVGERLAGALADAHAGTPPRHPEIDPSRITMSGDIPCLDAALDAGGPRESLFELGSLLFWLATGERPTVAWRLDPPKPPALQSLIRRATLARLLSPRADTRFESAQEARAALLRASEVSTEEPTSSWPAFRGDAQRSGSRCSARTPHGLVMLWDALVGPVVASPVVTDTLVIVVSADGRAFFLDRASGRVAHVVALGAAAESTPALSSTHVLVGTDSGELVAIHRQSGEVTSRARLGEMVRSSPVVADGRAFLGVIDPEQSGALVALSPDGAKVLWRRKLGAVFSSPALVADKVVVGSDDQKVHALERERGTLAWSTPLDGRIRATPAIDGDRAFVGTFGGRLAALDLADGKVVWSREMGESIYSSAAVTADLVVVGCHDGSLHGLAKATGEPRFRTQTRGPIVASPVAVGDAFLVASTDGGFYLVDQTGRIAERHALPGDGAQSSAAVDGEEIWVGSPRGVHSMKVA